MFPDRLCSALPLALALMAGPAFAAPDAVETSETLKAGSEALDQALATQADSVEEAAASQARVDETREQTRELLAMFRNRSRELESLTRYNDHVERMLAAQDQRIADTEEDLAVAALTERELIPLLERMVESLRRFVALDLPFERAEREAQLEALAAVIDDPAVTSAEKLRRILAAYRRELDYGRNLAAYRVPLPASSSAGKPLSAADAPTVDLLRVGRVALFYRSLDGRQLGIWDTSTGDWETLPARWRQPLAKALRVARKQSAPDILTLPLPAAGTRP
ncbi:DUF3450 domain-containing protein [Thiohalocapsa sp.]|uniref:DUF3450 domain-containing protein n=1 Tax=Thiohalocapsa sp. TaxID=2497641 RepID=UPI0025CEC006|nr:DUF3450 domain-containing protein [Thiohalocapsa sp.]